MKWNAPLTIGAAFDHQFHGAILWDITAPRWWQSTARKSNFWQKLDLAIESGEAARNMGARLVIRSIDGRRVEEEIAYPFDQDRVVIGRGRSADVRIPHRTISELHAILERTVEGYRLIDQASTNGTWVADQRLVPQRARRLKDGDVIRLGVYALGFHAGVLVTAPLTQDHTAELARQLVRKHMAPGHEAVRPPRLVVIAGQPTGAHVDIPPPPARLLVGRSDHCQLKLDDPDASREHAEVVHDLEGVLIRDLGSKNGMVVCGKKQPEARLQDGDELELGGCTLLFEEPAQAPLEALDGEDDEALTEPPRDAPDALAEPATPEAKAQEPVPVPKPTRERPSGQGIGPDLLVYGLAGLVLALSVAGLVLLMGD